MSTSKQLLNRKRFKQIAKYRKTQKHNHSIQTHLSKLLDSTSLLATKRQHPRTICFICDNSFLEDTQRSFDIQDQELINLETFRDIPPSNNSILSLNNDANCSLDSKPFVFISAQTLIPLVRKRVDARSQIEINILNVLYKCSCFMLIGHTDFYDQSKYVSNTRTDTSAVSYNVLFKQLLLKDYREESERIQNPRTVIMAVCFSQTVYSNFLNKNNYKCNFVLFTQSKINLKQTLFYMRNCVMSYTKSKADIYFCLLQWLGFPDLQIHMIDLQKRNIIPTYPMSSKLMPPHCSNMLCLNEKLNFVKFGVSVFFRQIQWKCKLCNFKTHLPTESTKLIDPTIHQLRRNTNKKNLSNH